MKKLKKILVLCLFLGLNIEAQELIQDKNFNEGFALWGTSTEVSEPLGKICRNDNQDCHPKWSLSEWHSETTLLGHSGGNSWGDPYKSVTISGNAITLAVDGDNEDYEGKEGCPGMGGDSWPHLLLGQTFNQKLGVLKALNLKLDAKLEYFSKNSSNNCFASQVTFYLFIANSKPTAMNNFSTGFWYGIHIFDNRYSYFQEKKSYDIGTKHYMYFPKTFNVLTVNRYGKILNNQIHINQNILPTFKKIVQKNGFNLNDLTITSMNVGWENASNNVADVKLSNFSLFAKSKSKNNIKAQITSPKAGTKLPSKVTFSWKKNDADKVALFISDHSSHNEILCSISTRGTSARCSAIPQNGHIIYADLYSFKNGKKIGHARTVYTAKKKEYKKAKITSPKVGTKLPSKVTFSWKKNDADKVALFVSDHSNHNKILCLTSTKGTSVTCNIPQNNHILYVDFFSFKNERKIGYARTVYRAEEAKVAQITSPKAETKLPSKVTFNWKKNGADKVAFYVHDHSNYNKILCSTFTAGTSKTCDIPQNGHTIYVDLYSFSNGQKIGDTRTIYKARK